MKDQYVFFEDEADAVELSRTLASIVFNCEEEDALGARIEELKSGGFALLVQTKLKDTRTACEDLGHGIEETTKLYLKIKERVIPDISLSEPEPIEAPDSDGS